MKSWDTSEQPVGDPRELCQVSLSSFWYRGKAAWRSLCSRGCSAPQVNGGRGSSVSRQKSLGPVSAEPGILPRVFPLAEVLLSSGEVWLGG